MENKQTFFEQQPVVREPGLLDVRQQSPDVAPVKKTKYRWIWLVFAVVFTGVIIAILISFQRHSKNNVVNDSSAKTQDINLSSVSPSAVTFTMKENDRVVFNGQLQANEGIVLSPTQETPTSVIGQIYLDNTTNQIRYYNGTGYLSLAVDDGQLCKNNNPNCGFLNDAAIANLVTQAQATGLIQNAINGLVIPALPQDLATSASPQFAGLKLKNGGGGIVTLQSSASSASLTFTLPAADGTASQCLTTNGAGQLSFSSCSTGSGTAFVQGGNTFGATATLGTNDANPLVFRTNGVTQATLAVGGALTLQNSIDSTSALNILSSTSATVFNVDTTNGRVGIGTATPQTKLSVVNTSLVAQTAFKVNQENASQYIAEFRSNDINVFTLGGTGAALFQNTVDMVDALRINDDSGTAVLAVNNTWGTLGAVGIGTSGPTAKLSVIGIGNATGDAFRVSNSTSTGNIAIFADDTTTIATIANGGAVILQNSVDSTSGFQILDQNGDTPILNVDTTNERVGIGNAAPTVALDVTGAGKFSTTLEVDGNMAVGSDASLTNAALIYGKHSFDSGVNCLVGCYGVMSDITIDGSVYAPLTGVANLAKVSTANTAFTLPSAAGFWVQNATKGAASTITNQYGVYVSNLTSATSNYGVYIEGASTYALFVDSGTTRLDGQLLLNGIATDITTGTDEDLTVVANGTGIINLNDTVAIGNLTNYDVDDSYAVCRDASTSLLTRCDPSTNEPPLLISGNSYGANIVLGTNDSNSLAFETGGTTRWLIDTSGHLLPNVDDTYNIGSDTARVQDIYLGPGTLHVGTSTSDEYKLSYDTTNNTVELQATVDAVQGFQVLDTDGGTPILNVDTTNERVGIGNAAPTVALDVTGAGKFSTYVDVDNSIAIGSGSTGGENSLANIGIVHTFSASTVAGCGFGCYGVIASVTADNPASASVLTAYYAQASTAASSFTLTNAYGLYVNSASLGAGSTITNNFGIRVLAQTAGASDYGIAVEAADTQTLWLSSNADNTTTAAGIAFGLSRDTNLYRSAANTLKTDDNLLIQTATNSTAAFQVQNSAGSTIFNVDTSNSKVGTPDTATASTNSNAFVLQSGNASGTTSNSGNVTIDVGTATGTLGVINIGTTNALTVTIGKSGATLTVDSNATFNGTLTVGGHVISANTSGTTTIAAGAAACTTPTVMTVTGNDTAGLISVTTGTGCAATGTLATVTFANTYGAAPRVVLTPTNAGAAGLTYYNGSANATTFTLDTNTVPVDATSYTYNYFVIK